MKIDWSMLPEGSQWAAMDQNGIWWGYTKKPDLQGTPGFWSSNGFVLTYQDGRPLVNDNIFFWSEGTPWNETLTQRPDETEDTPTYNTPDGEPPYTPPPSTPEHAIRVILETIHDLRALKLDELDSPISSLKTAIYRLSDKL